MRELAEVVEEDEICFWVPVGLLRGGGAAFGEPSLIVTDFVDFDMIQSVNTPLAVLC